MENTDKFITRDEMRAAISESIHQAGIEFRQDMQFHIDQMKEEGRETRREIKEDGSEMRREIKEDVREIRSDMRTVSERMQKMQVQISVHSFIIALAVIIFLTPSLKALFSF